MGTSRLFIVGSLIGAIFLCSFQQEEKKIIYMQRATVSGEKGGIPGDTLAFQDTHSSDSLFLLLTGENIPLHYFKRIHTGVCFDNKCRELDMILYWNITGRYLGFELPVGEFLSKSEHKPFSAEEYERLNVLLADPTLPFGDISFNSLMDASKSASGLVDGVSGATSAEVEEIVVSGAAYTTYTLWNIVYGPAFDRIIQLTDGLLTPELTDLILHSPDINDRVWALQRIDQTVALDKELSATLLDMIAGEEFYLSYRAINAIGSIHLESDSFQSALFSKYGEVNFSIRRMIIGKFMEAPLLTPDVIEKSRNYLEQLNGEQLGDLLGLYSMHSIDDPETCQAIAKILQKENRYISQKAYDFLKGVDTRDSMITDHLNAYERQLENIWVP
jgi:hypothetical protein